MGRVCPLYQAGNEGGKGELRRHDPFRGKRDSRSHFLASWVEMASRQDFCPGPYPFLNLRRNEVKATVNARSVKTVMNRGEGDLWISAPDEIQQRAALLLRDVRYIIEAHFDMTDPATRDNPGKFQDIMKRRIQKGQFYHQPYFGCREFPVNFAPCEEISPCPEELKGERDLGWMLWDLDYSDPKEIRPLFFRAVLRDGVLEVPPRDSEEVRG